MCRHRVVDIVVLGRPMCWHCWEEYCKGEVLHEAERVSVSKLPEQREHSGRQLLLRV